MNKTQRLLNKFRSKPNRTIAPGMELPNLSGDHSGGLVRETPVNDTDIANKKYVDDTAGGVINDLIPELDKTYVLGTHAKMWLAAIVLTMVIGGGIMFSQDTDNFLLINASTRVNGSLDVLGDINFSNLIYGNGSQLTGLDSAGDTNCTNNNSCPLIVYEDELNYTTDTFYYDTDTNLTETDVMNFVNHSNVNFTKIDIVGGSITWNGSHMLFQ